MSARMCTNGVKEVKRLLFRLLRDSLRDPAKVSRIIYDEYGVKVKPSWSSIESFIVGNEDVRPQELAVLLMDMGVEIPELKWIKILEKYCGV